MTHLNIFTDASKRYRITVILLRFVRLECKEFSYKYVLERFSDLSEILN